MEAPKTSTPDKNVWEDFRDTVKGGVRELRNVGDELARQGRLRMDIYQTERRLKSVCEDLGTAVHACIAEDRQVTADDPAIAELNQRVTYYTGELKRLNAELQKAPSNAN
jgi:hypothetical protein